MMNKIFFYEQWKELYANYLLIRPVQKQRDFTYEGGGLNVTISTNKRYNRPITKRD